MTEQKQKVWVAKLYRKNTEGIYHTRRDCRKLNRSDNIAGKELEVLDNDMRECRTCANKIEGKERYQERDCPYCGETVGKLPDHILKCPEK